MLLDPPRGHRPAPHGTEPSGPAQDRVTTTLSQDEKNTDVTPGMQNCSVYPKSN